MYAIPVLHTQAFHSTNSICNEHIYYLHPAAPVYCCQPHVVGLHKYVFLGEFEMSSRVTNAGFRWYYLIIIEAVIGRAS